MKRSVLGLMVLAAVTLCHVHNAQAEDAASFRVQALTMSSNSETNPLSNRKHTKITRSGQGETEDITCDDETDSEGYVFCEVVTCNKDSRVAKTYYIHFESPYTYSDVSPAKIRISQCKVLPPEPYVAYVGPRGLLVAFLDADINSLIGGTRFSRLTSEENKNLFSESYALKLHEIMNAPFGDVRVSSVRKHLQDSSAIALFKSENAKAAEFQSLLYVHANAALWGSFKDIGIDTVTMKKSWQLATLDSNLKKVDSGLIDYEKDFRDGPRFAYAAVQPSLDPLKSAVSAGRVTTREFKQLEDLNYAAGNLLRPSLHW